MPQPKGAEESVEQTEEPKAKRTMPVRIEEMVLENEYEGWTFTANRNFTFGELEDLASFTYTRMVKALRVTVTGWTNFVDREGEPIPFIAKADLEAAQKRAAKALEPQVQPAGEFPLAPPVRDPWADLSTDLLVAMARAVVGLPSVPLR